MNPPNAYPVVAFNTTRKTKMALVEYSRTTGIPIKHVMESLVRKFLDEQNTINPTIKLRTKK